MSKNTKPEIVLTTIEDLLPGTKLEFVEEASTMFTQGTKLIILKQANEDGAVEAMYDNNDSQVVRVFPKVSTLLSSTKVNFQPERTKLSDLHPGCVLEVLVPWSKGSYSSFKQGDRLTLDNFKPIVEEHQNRFKRATDSYAFLDNDQITHFTRLVSKEELELEQKERLSKLETVKDEQIRIGTKLIIVKEIPFVSAPIGSLIEIQSAASPDSVRISVDKVMGISNKTCKVFSFTTKQRLLDCCAFAGEVPLSDKTTTPRYTPAPVTPPKPWEEMTDEEKLEEVVKLNFWIKPANDQYVHPLETWRSTYAKKQLLAECDWSIKTIDSKPGVVIDIPPEHTSWTKQSKSVACCAFDGTNEFLRHVLSKSLHSSDRDWYVDHPYTEGAGLPAQHTLTVLQDLVRPWGLRISRVWMRVGHIDWPEHLIWKQALGCNPLATVDLETTDEEYVTEMLSHVPEDADPATRENFKNNLEAQVKEFRFSYVKDLPPEAMVIFEGGYDSKYASGGGHASFRAPRSRKSNSWGLAIQYDKMENVTYFTEEPTYEDKLPEVQAHFTLNISGCKVKNGKTFAEVMGSYSGYQGGYTWKGEDDKKKAKQPTKGYQDSGTNLVGGKDKTTKSNRKESNFLGLTRAQYKKGVNKLCRELAGSVPSNKVRSFVTWCSDKEFDITLPELCPGDFELDVTALEMFLQQLRMISKASVPFNLLANFSEFCSEPHTWWEMIQSKNFKKFLETPAGKDAELVTEEIDDLILEFAAVTDPSPYLIYNLDKELQKQSPNYWPRSLTEYIIESLLELLFFVDQNSNDSDTDSEIYKYGLPGWDSP